MNARANVTAAIVNKVKGGYTYGPGESVVASCNAITFFNHEPQPAAPAAPGAKK